MSKEYNHRSIEKKWQRIWKKSGIYESQESPAKPKSYVLDMFPYPSGDGLHVGHPKGYIATDIYSRHKRMQGHMILHPMGFDAFGLPAENFAIKNKVHPKKAVDANIKYFKEQLARIGFDHDWKREINTTDPEYYRWTQWIFLQLLKKGLAYQSYEPINWCPSCQTGLANEDLEDGKCERCGSVVEKRPLRQWVLKITEYADRLLKDIDGLNWPESIKESQRNWIGKSVGAEIGFRIQSVEYSGEVKIFTTRPDTIFGATYLVLSPEHEIISNFRLSISNWKEVEKYIAEAKNKTEIERTAEGKEKTGVELKGIKAINPANNEEIPVWIADYVLADYGTGAIMAVPAHDLRDFQFAKKFNLPIVEVISGGDTATEAYTGSGLLINSREFSGKSNENCSEEMLSRVHGRKTVRYKLRDWVFSRQRYWGEPIPVIHCDQCKNAKQKALIIHGFEGSPEGNWFPWMKKELEARGFAVSIPAISTSRHPTVESWMAELEPAIKNFGPHDIVIGHSLGAKAALMLLSKTKISIKHLFLVGSAIGTVRDWDAFAKVWDDPQSDLAALKKFAETSVDFETAGSYADRVTFLVSEDDEVIKPFMPERLPRAWNVLTWSGYGHFQARESAELRDLFLTAKNDGVVPVPEKELPVKLPNVKHYEPTGTGESPLAAITKWVNVKCPTCHGKARRETNTMPQWAGSSWYYLRYMDPTNATVLVDVDKEKYWAPVDLYVGGAEHATRHLIYARFWHKFLLDIGVVSTSEPFSRLQHVGLIIAEDGRKMSKRYGNVINPDDIVETYGADTLRIYEMFMGPFDQSIAWNTKGLIGGRRFLERVWKLKDKVQTEKGTVQTETETLLHQTIKKVGEDIESMKFNTAISQLMILANALEKQDTVPRDVFISFLQLLAPIAPHITEELWHSLGEKGSIHSSNWPLFDATKLVGNTVKIAVQVDGKVRATLEQSRTADEQSVTASAMNLPDVKKWIGERKVVKVIYVQGRLVSIVLDKGLDLK